MKKLLLAIFLLTCGSAASADWFLYCQLDDDFDNVGYGRVSSNYNVFYCVVGTSVGTCFSGCSSSSYTPENDNCPTVSNASQLDIDGDGLGDVCDNASYDNDSDGFNNAIDNCPMIANVDQLNTDGDAQGNACDNDDDNDGVADTSDALPLDVTESVDTDGDGIGNGIDIDDDNDTVSDISDNCPLNTNTNQADLDGDSFGDACDGDVDGDGLENAADTDDDNDGVADESDAFPFDHNESVDTDHDGIGNGIEIDDDNDTVSDISDNCPLNANTDQTDQDSDGSGNACDTDDDNDGIADATDKWPLDSLYSADRDSDTLPDNWEVDHGRNPNVADYAINTTCTKDDNGGTCSPVNMGSYLYYAAFNNSCGYLKTSRTDYLYTAAYDGVTISSIYTCDPQTYPATVMVKIPADYLVQFYFYNGNFCFLDRKGKSCYSKVGVSIPVTPVMVIDSDHDGMQRPNDPDDLDVLNPVIDTDNDSVNNNVDNCIQVSNVDQLNTDGDAQGNVCDADDDNDGVPDISDAFPLNANESVDTDGDGIGNNADTTPNGDTDNDGVDNATDNCVSVSNPDQLSTDGDAQGNACDTDDDNDGVADVSDAFPLDAAESVDTDGDGVGDNTDSTPNGDTDSDGIDNLTDNCVAVSNADQLNTDGDTEGNVCDNDDDNDGVADVSDAFPLDATESLDTDSDGIGDNADATPNGDTDSDGVDNLSDNCAVVSNANQLDTDNDNIGDVCDTTPNGDTDNDGVDNFVDNCAVVSNANQLDTDNDNIGDVCDSTVNGDTDNDGIDNLADNCPAVSNVDQINTDGDTQGDACDTTPNGDTDGDGVDNNSDNCPTVSNADQVDIDADGAGDVCDLFPLDGELLLEQNGTARNENFASSIAMADMNDDGVIDVLVGAPMANVLVDGKTLKKAGVIRIISGADNSILRTLNGTVAHQQFGTAITVVDDQNSDSMPDIVVGEPLADIIAANGFGKTKKLKNAGRVVVYSGSNGALINVIAEGSKASDHFGAAVAVGDLNNDATIDLVVGSPNSRVQAKRSGQVTVFNGLSSAVLYQSSGDQAGESFGAAVAVDHQRLYVGSPLRDVFQWKDAGRVQVFNTANGSHHAFFIRDGAAQGGHFGAAISAANDEWAVGIPLADSAGKDAGSVQLFSGLNITPVTTLSGKTAGDNFGSSVNMQGDVNQDGKNDLAIGAAKFNVNTSVEKRKSAGIKTVLLKDAGRVEVLSGAAL